MPKRLINYLRCLSFFLLLAQQSSAIILYSGDNSANQTAPDAERTDIFNAVARVTAGGGSPTSGSAVHIRGRFMLTADHVTNRDYLTFDGTTFWERDTTVQIGSTDMRLIRLKMDPGLPDIDLYAGSSIGKTGTLVAWGRGRDPAIADGGIGPTNIWTWGGDSTIAKRWGTNRIDSTSTETYSGYSYTALVTDLDRNQGSNEAATVTYDSGSGIFIDDNGTWKLAGITTRTYQVTANKATFNGGADGSRFVEINSYLADIEEAIRTSTTFTDWLIDHSLTGPDADDEADTDGDGIGQLLEFAFNGDPQVNDVNILPFKQLTEDGGSTYLEITYTRPDYNNGLTYIVKTTSDLNSWPADSTGIDASPSIVDNGDGTKTWTHRRTQAVSNATQAFIRVDVSD